MPFEIVPAGTNIDFLGKRRICLAISLALIALGAVLALTNGVKVGLDFAGGTEVQLLFEEGVLVDETALRDLTTEKGFENPQVVRFGDEGVNEFLVKFQDVAEGSEAAAEAARLEEEAKAAGESAAPQRPIDRRQGGKVRYARRLAKA